MRDTFYSTGIRALDNDHAHIDAVISHVARSNDAEEEKRHLMDIYCSIISHVESKKEILGRDLSQEEQSGDAAFLDSVRKKIRERENGLVSRRQLVTDLRHMLMVHAMAYQPLQKKSA